MHLAGVGWLLMPRKVFAGHPGDEEAVARSLGDAEEQGVLGHIQVGCIDDGRIQLFHLTFTHLNGKSEKSAVCTLKLVFLYF